MYVDKTWVSVAHHNALWLFAVKKVWSKKGAYDTRVSLSSLPQKPPKGFLLAVLNNRRFSELISC